MGDMMKARVMKWIRMGIFLSFRASVRGCDYNIMRIPCRFLYEFLMISRICKITSFNFSNFLYRKVSCKEN
jgi:hypothetical protein